MSTSIPEKNRSADPGEPQDRPGGHGFADCCWNWASLQLRPGVRLGETVMQFITDEGRKVSEELAKERGPSRTSRVHLRQARAGACQERDGHTIARPVPCPSSPVFQRHRAALRTHLCQEGHDGAELLEVNPCSSASPRRRLYSDSS